MENDRVRRRAPRGWTLMELMIIVAVLGILAAVVVNQVNELHRRAQESALKGNLSAIRGALLIYYGDNGAEYPQSLSTLAEDRRYLPALPHTDIPSAEKLGNPGHRDVRAEERDYGRVPSGPAEFRDEGAALWGYVNVATAPSYGHVFVNCAHRDSRNSQWTSW